MDPPAGEAAVLQHCKLTLGVRGGCDCARGCHAFLEKGEGPGKAGGRDDDWEQPRPPGRRRRRRGVPTGLTGPPPPPPRCPCGGMMVGAYMGGTVGMLFPVQSGCIIMERVFGRRVLDLQRRFAQ